MSAIVVRPGMELPSLAANQRVSALLRARLRTPTRGAENSHAYWPAEFFGLHKVRLFRDAPETVQRAALENCGRALLEEAYFIEKSGVTFAAAMVLLGESIEERMLYACFAAEEARHFNGVRAFLAGPLPAQPESSFLRLLSGVIASAERTTLQLTIQVVLEGWGLLHYRTLRDSCLDSSLRHLLNAILLDEAGHHGSGRVLFGGTSLDDKLLRGLEEVLSSLLQLVQYGPQATLEGLERAHSGLTRAQKIGVLQELEGPTEAQRKLNHLQHLLQFDSLTPLIDRLQSRGLFSPFQPEECV